MWDPTVYISFSLRRGRTKRQLPYVCAHDMYARTPCILGTSVCSSRMQGMLCHRFLVAAVPFTMSILCIAYMGRLARLAPVRASDVKEKVGVTILAGLLESAAMQCHESVTFFIFRDWGIVQCQKIKMRQILSPTCVKT